MEKLPDELQINIFHFLCPTHVIVLNKQSERLIKCNYIWGPIVFHRFNISKSNNFFEEFKWQRRLAQHRFQYQRQWTLGCVGKVKTLGEKPRWPRAHTSWAPALISCAT